MSSVLFFPLSFSFIFCRVPLKKKKKNSKTHISSQSAWPLLPRFRYQGAARIARWPACVAAASARRQALSASTDVASSLGGPLLPSHH